VVNTKDGNLGIGLKNGETGVINKQDLTWTTAGGRKSLQKGDVILVSKSESGRGFYKLEQIPDINGGMLAMEPYSGKVLAFSGGYSFELSSFNRAFQARRQPGSTFKPFVYVTALEKGYKPNMIILDEPVSLSQGAGMPAWVPKNYGSDYLGAITMRKALEKSRNIPTVRLIRSLGLKSVVETSENMGVYHNPPGNYSVALGAFETTVADIVNGYNIFASGGQRTFPYVIAAVYDRKGNLIYKGPSTSCKNCEIELMEFAPDTAPRIQFENDQVIDPIANFQITSILEGAVQRGTARRTAALKRNIACKTGTTNDSKDTWFICYNPMLTTGLYVGYDAPKSIGAKATGGSIAQPIALPFMEKVFDGADNPDFPVPEGIKFINIDYNSGHPTSASGGSHVVKEAFRDERNGESDEEDNGDGAGARGGRRDADDYLLSEPTRRKSDKPADHNNGNHNRDSKGGAQQGFGGIY